MNLSQMQFIGVGMGLLALLAYIVLPSSPIEEPEITSPSTEKEAKEIPSTPPSLPSKRLPKPIQTGKKLDLRQQRVPIVKAPQGLLEKNPPNIALGGYGKDIRYAANANGLRRAMQKNMQQAMSCYQSTKNEFPDIENRLSFSFRLTSEGEDGFIDQVKLEDSATTYESLEDCIFALVNPLRFYAPEEGELSLRHTITFPE